MLTRKRIKGEGKEKLAGYVGKLQKGLRLGIEVNDKSSHLAWISLSLRNTDKR